LRRSAQLHLDYGPIRQRLDAQGIQAPTPLDVSRAVCAIRSEKLPDPARLGNAGSFFKNPLVPAEQAERLGAEHPELVAYPAAEGQVKLAAGWLIERAGWKGFRDGDAGVHERQALVLVNRGGASGADVRRIADAIMADVERAFGVRLEPEPVFV
jgi:UDP-N-acetylmuramate dehydrogenase